ncbi:hypothetical protein RhiirA1_447226 [Rhizophagus irregularis]|uniref:Uncharacterized protein n=1 Tax=Rhizophagus irregularis TaxID=588596 RepID=A0A2N0QRH3_9GLOM|nr:hypothetical protein RhiirA1_447226 [Rhizophagus irregularis]
MKDFQNMYNFHYKIYIYIKSVGDARQAFYRNLALNSKTPNILGLQLRSLFDFGSRTFTKSNKNYANTYESLKFLHNFEFRTSKFVIDKYCILYYCIFFISELMLWTDSLDHTIYRKLTVEVELLKADDLTIDMFWLVLTFELCFFYFSI